MTQRLESFVIHEEPVFSVGLRRSQQAFQLGPRARIRDVCFGQSRSPGLIDSVPQCIEAMGAVRIGIDDDGNAMRFGGSCLYVIQIQPLGTRVDFQQHAMIGSRVEKCGEIDIRSRAVT